MRTAVFDDKKMIQGFLTHPDNYRGRRSFVLRSCPPVSASVTEMPFASVSFSQCMFEWGWLGSSRSSNDTWYCCVLLTKTPELLINVDGFEFFAEVYGVHQDYGSSYPGPMAVHESKHVDIDPDVLKGKTYTVAK